MAVSVVDTNIDVDTLRIESSTNLSTTSIPNWLDTDFLSKHLQCHFNDRSIIIRSYQVKSATAKGENYASSIYRVTLQFIDGKAKAHDLNLIIKTALTGELAFDILSECDVYDKEIDFYVRIAPRIKLLLKQLNETDQLLPGTYGVCEQNKAILFEDLAMKGYRLLPVQRGFDMQAAKMILKKAATLHACCAILQEQQADFFGNFKHGKLLEVCFSCDGTKDSFDVIEFPSVKIIFFFFRYNVTSHRWIKHFLYVPVRCCDRSDFSMA